MEKKIRKPKRTFTDEFKKESLQLVKNIGVSQASKELNIDESLLRLWRSRLEGPGRSSEKDKLTSELQRENRRLAQENEYLKIINEVLKKSTAIFSADIMGGKK